MTFEVRTKGEPREFVGPIRSAVESVDKDLPLIEVRTQEEQIDATLAPERSFATVTGGFGRPCACACLHRSLWRRGCRGVAQNQRDWHSHGAWRTNRSGAPDGSWRSDRPGTCGHWRGPLRRVASYSLIALISLWAQANRFTHARRRWVAVVDRRHPCQLGTCAQSISDSTGAGIATRIRSANAMSPTHSPTDDVTHLFV